MTPKFQPKNTAKIGDRVRLVRDVETMAGVFPRGITVILHDLDQARGYGFVDDEGNRVIEAGYDFFEKID